MKQTLIAMPAHQSKTGRVTRMERKERANARARERKKRKNDLLADWSRRTMSHENKIKVDDSNDITIDGNDVCEDASAPVDRHETDKCLLGGQLRAKPENWFLKGAFDTVHATCSLLLLLIIHSYSHTHTLSLIHRQRSICLVRGR